MKATNGYYSLIQYCPDFSRAEVANIGALLFCPELNFIDANFSSANDRISTIFGRDTFDKKRINLTKKSIRERLKIDKESFCDLDDLNKYIGEMANEIKITAPRSIKVYNPEEELRSLFKELVGDRAAKKPILTESFKKLDMMMHRPVLKRKVKFKQRVNVPFAGKELTIDYVFDNGAKNLVKTHLFHLDPSAITQAFTLAGEGRFIQKYGASGTKQRFIVVGDTVASSGRRDYRNQIKDIFEKMEIKTVWGSEVEQFVLDLEKEAH